MADKINTLHNILNCLKKGEQLSETDKSIIIAELSENIAIYRKFKNDNTRIIDYIEEMENKLNDKLIPINTKIRSCPVCSGTLQPKAQGCMIFKCLDCDRFFEMIKDGPDESTMLYQERDW